VTAAVMKDDRPAMFHYHRYFPRRFAANEQTGGQHHRDSGANEKRELRRLVSVIADKLKDPAVKPVNERALEIIERAYALERAAVKRRRRHQGTQIRYPFQRSGDVPWTPE
jgi:hypothetical protein